MSMMGGDFADGRCGLLHPGASDKTAMTPTRSRQCDLPLSQRVGFDGRNGSVTASRDLFCVITLIPPSAAMGRLAGTVSPAAPSTLHEILIRRAVPSNEQVRVSPCIDVPLVGNLRRNDDVVSNLQRGRFLSERVGEPAAKHDGVFRVFVPVQLEARPGGKMRVIRFSAGLRIGAQNGAPSTLWDSQRSAVRLAPPGGLQTKRSGWIGSELTHLN